MLNYHKSVGKPLLISHGWPGSIWEFYKMIPMLTDPAAYGGRDEDAFEVIVPSIPGFGFSEAPHRQGINIFITFLIFHLPGFIYAKLLKYYFSRLS